MDSLWQTTGADLACAAGGPLCGQSPGTGNITLCAMHYGFSFLVLERGSKGG